MLSSAENRRMIRDLNRMKSSSGTAGRPLQFRNPSSDTGSDGTVARIAQYIAKISKDAARLVIGAAVAQPAVAGALGLGAVLTVGSLVRIHNNRRNRRRLFKAVVSEDMTAIETILAGLTAEERLTILEYEEKESGRTPLLEAASRGNDLIVTMLINYDANILALERKSGRGLLHVALATYTKDLKHFRSVQHPLTNMVKTLLGLESLNPYLEDRDRLTPLDIALGMKDCLATKAVVLQLVQHLQEDQQTFWEVLNVKVGEDLVQMIVAVVSRHASPGLEGRNFRSKEILFFKYYPSADIDAKLNFKLWPEFRIVMPGCSVKEVYPPNGAVGETRITLQKNHCPTGDGIIYDYPAVTKGGPGGGQRTVIISALFNKPGLHHIFLRICKLGAQPLRSSKGSMILPLPDHLQTSELSLLERRSKLMDDEEELQVLESQLLMRSQQLREEEQSLVKPLCVKCLAGIQEAGFLHENEYHQCLCITCAEELRLQAMTGNCLSTVCGMQIDHVITKVTRDDRLKQRRMSSIASLLGE